MPRERTRAGGRGGRRRRAPPRRPERRTQPGASAPPAPIPAHFVGSPAETRKRPPPRERLLIAAEAVFSARGYAHASVEDVLGVADVSRGTFYQYYANKEDLAAALLERALEVLLSTVAAQLSRAASLDDKLASALDRYLSLWQAHGRLVLELSIGALRPGSRLGPARLAAVKTTVGLIDAGMRRRGIRHDPLVYEHLILGIEAVLMHALLEGPLDDANKARVHAALLPLLLRVLGDPDTA